jgi:hypothetical protein
MTNGRLAQQELARRYCELRERIDKSGDPDLLALIEERDMLKMNYEMGREIGAENGAQAKRFLSDEEIGSCGCDVCAIGRALDKTERLRPQARLILHTASDETPVGRAARDLADAVLGSNAPAIDPVLAEKIRNYCDEWDSWIARDEPADEGPAPIIAIGLLRAALRSLGATPNAPGGRKA